MKLKKLLEGIKTQTDITKIKNIEIKDITCDSSRVKKDVLFSALVGSNTDGHKYAQSAIEKGASAVVCQRDLGLENQIIVEDSRYAYAKIAANFQGNPSKKLKFIGITGTNGKTTSTKLIKTVLQNMGHKVGLIGTIQNEIQDEIIKTAKTTPDPVEYQKLIKKMAYKGCEYVVMEVSSHALDQKRLGDTTFEVAGFLNLTQDHLDYHKDMEDYYRAKRELFKLSKVAVISIDDEYGLRLSKEIECKRYTYTKKLKLADFKIKDIKSSVEGVEFTLKGKDVLQELTYCTPGLFTADNVAMVAIVCLALGFNIKRIKQAIKNCEHVKGRSEIINTEKGFSIICDYAHSPGGLENILESINGYKKGRVITVFGCGGDRDRSKRPIMGETASINSDFLVVTSDNPRTENPDKIIDEIIKGVKKTNTPYVRITNRKQAIEYAIKNANKDDIILLAGKGHEDYQVIGTQKIDFDEREIVRQILRQQQQ